MLHSQPRPLHVLNKAEDFQVNGYNPLCGICSQDLFERSHAILSFVNGVSGPDVIDEIGPANPAILLEVMRGVETLLSLGLLAQQNEAIRII